MRSLTIGLIGTMMVLGTGAMAEDAPAAKCGGGERGGHGRHGNFAAMMTECDKDGDGKLSDEEKADMKAAWEARREARHKEMWAQCDTDGDGNISVEEITASLEQMGAQSDRRKAFESKLTEEEKAAMKSVAAKWITGMVVRFDTNGDGQVSEEELAASMAVVRDQFLNARP